MHDPILHGILKMSIFCFILFRMDIGSLMRSSVTGLV